MLYVETQPRNYYAYNKRKAVAQSSNKWRWQYIYFSFGSLKNYCHALCHRKDKLFKTLSLIQIER